MNSSLRTVLIFLLSCSCVNILPAQSPEEDYVSFEFFTLSWEGRLEGNILYQANASSAPEKVEGFSRFIKGPYSYFGPKRLTFFTEEPNEEGLPVRTPVAYTDLSESVKRGILLFTPPREGRYRIFPIVINENNFAPGSYRFFNLSDRKVVIRLGDERNVIQARGEVIMQPSIENRQRFMAQMASANDASEMELIFSTEWTHQANKRVIVFFYDDGSGSVQVKVQPI